MENREAENPGGKLNVTLATVTKRTEAYLAREETQLRLMTVAQLLVENRQIRAKNRERWDLVATGYRYHCTFNRCRDGNRYS